jgi:hypothetical protein
MCAWLVFSSPLASVAAKGALPAVANRLQMSRHRTDNEIVNGTSKSQNQTSWMNLDFDIVPLSRSESKTTSLSNLF